MSERRLRQQGEALAEADRRKNEFLAMLAHELRNPLQPIRTAIELLRSPATPADRRDWSYAVIERQVSQLVRLVDDLLDASRISSGKLVAAQGAGRSRHRARGRRRSRSARQPTRATSS